MKKILLTMIVSMTMGGVFSASAEEPEYTVKGTVLDVESWSSYNYAPVGVGLTPIVEKYTDSIVVRNWLGIEGYDIAYGITSGALYYTKSGELTKYTYGSYLYIDGGVAEENSSTSSPCYMYIYDNSSFKTCTITPESGTESDKTYASGSLFLAGYEYYGTNCATYGYAFYYLEWTTDPSAGITSTTIASDAKNAPMYNLAGQRVSSSAKGLVIKNGKKMILK